MGAVNFILFLQIAQPLRRLLAQPGLVTALYANAPLKAAVKGMQNLLVRLKETGTTGDADDLMISMAERNELTRYREFRGMEERYRD